MNPQPDNQYIDTQRGVVTNSSASVHSENLVEHPFEKRVAIDEKALHLHLESAKSSLLAGIVSLESTVLGDVAGTHTEKRVDVAVVPPVIAHVGGPHLASNMESL